MLLANPFNSYAPAAGNLHDHAARVLLLRLSVEHLARSAQVVGLGDKVVEFLAWSWIYH
jgi:hypothetical protein